MTEPIMDKREFFVTATCDIGPRIRKGDHVLINRERAPAGGKYVLVCDRLELWAMQPEIRGVAVGRFTEEDCHG